MMAIAERGVTTATIARGAGDRHAVVWRDVGGTARRRSRRERRMRGGSQSEGQRGLAAVLRWCYRDELDVYEVSGRI